MSIMLLPIILVLCSQKNNWVRHLELHNWAKPYTNWPWQLAILPTVCYLECFVNVTLFCLLPLLLTHLPSVWACVAAAVDSPAIRVSMCCRCCWLTCHPCEHVLPLLLTHLPSVWACVAATVDSPAIRVSMCCRCCWLTCHPCEHVLPLLLTHLPSVWACVAAAVDSPAIRVSMCEPSMQLISLLHLRGCKPISADYACNIPICLMFMLSIFSSGLGLALCPVKSFVSTVLPTCGQWIVIAVN